MVIMVITERFSFIWCNSDDEILLSVNQLILRLSSNRIWIAVLVFSSALNCIVFDVWQSDCYWHFIRAVEFPFKNLGFYIFKNLKSPI